LSAYLQQLNQRLSQLINEGENVFLVDSIPVPICKIVREKSSKSAKSALKLLPIKVILPLIKPGILATSFTWLLQLKVYFMLWI
jgi:hypothetical protein